MKSFEKVLLIIAVIFGIIGFLLGIYFYENKILYAISYVLIFACFIILTWGKFFSKLQPFRFSITLAVMAVLLAISVTYVIHWLKIMSPENEFIVMIISFNIISSILYTKNKSLEKLLNDFFYLGNKSQLMIELNEIKRTFTGPFKIFVNH